MDSKVKDGIKAGIISGIILIVLGLLNNELYTRFVMPLSTERQLEIGQMIGVLSMVLIVAVFLFAGTLSALFARPLIRERGDALVVGAVAGGVAGFLQMALSILSLAFSAFEAPLALGGMELTLTIISWLLVLILGTVLSAAGALAYANATLKLK